MKQNSIFQGAYSLVSEIAKKGTDLEFPGGLEVKDLMLGSIPGLGTFICHRHSQKQNKVFASNVKCNGEIKSGAGQNVRSHVRFK